MKKAILIVLSCLTLVSYAQKKPDGILSGCWVDEKYVHRVLSGMSLYDAQIGQLTHFRMKDCYSRVIWFNKKCKDTALIIYINEVGYYVTFRKTRSGYSVRKGIVDEDDSVEYVKILAPNKISIKGMVFIRLPIDTGIYDQEPPIIEYLLFKGKYITSTGKEVEFTKNGQVKGLDTINYYLPFVDYYEPGPTRDKLILTRNLNKPFLYGYRPYYGFKFNKDTLNIYKLDCKVRDSASHECFEVENGPLLYKMWKHK